MDASLAGLAEEDGELPEGKKEEELKDEEELKEEVKEEEPAETQAESSAAKAAPAAAAPAPAPLGSTSAGAKPIAEGSFKVLAHLNLGLNLKLGSVYKADELRRKCGDQKSKLKSLEKFMKDPAKLAPVPAASPKPQAPVAAPAASAASSPANARLEAAPARKLAPVAAASPKRKEKAPAPPETSCPVASPPRAKRARTKAPDEGSPPPVKFLAGQIVWHAVAGSTATRLAKVATVAETADSPYGIRYIAEGGSDDASDSTEAKREDLKPFNIKELPNHLMNVEKQAASSASPASLTMSGVWVPGVRKSKAFALGEVVWFNGTNRPSWPAKIQMMPLDGEDKYRVELFGTQGGCEDGEVLAATSAQLVAFDKDDMPAFYQVAKAVQDAVLKQQASSL